MHTTGIRVYSLELPLAGAGYTFANGKRLTTVGTIGYWSPIDGDHTA